MVEKSWRPAPSEEIMACEPGSLTGAYLSGKRIRFRYRSSAKEPTGFITVRGANGEQSEKYRCEDSRWES